MAFIAVYDAIVLYPGSLRDLLIRLGQPASTKPNGAKPSSTRWSTPSPVDNPSYEAGSSGPASS